MKQYSYKQFSYENLLKAKEKTGITFGLCIPTLNEESNIGKTIEVINSCSELFDKVIVIDSGSTDKTKNICKKMGIDFFDDKKTSKNFGLKFYRGKGFNLWLSLFILKTDVVVWVDADIVNINKQYLFGLVGPFLKDRKLKFLKGYYKKENGGGRVTELMVRPFFNLVFPPLSDVIQPLSGECAGKRDYLNSLFFYSKYSVEVALLVQSLYLLQDKEFGQVYLGEKQHASRSLENISICSASIMKTLFEMMELYKNIKIDTSNIYQYYSNKDLSKNIAILGEKKLPPVKKEAVEHEALQPGRDVVKNEV